MFFFFIGLLCGVYIGQEVPSMPKLKPKLTLLYDKLFKDERPSEPSSEDASSKID